MRMRYVLTLAISSIFTLVCGCTEPVSPLRPTDLGNDRMLTQHAARFWINHNVAPWHRDTKRKVAIAEFNVEFVTERLEAVSGGGQPFVRRLTDYGEGLKLELPGVLYSLLQSEGNMNLIPMDKVNEAKAYAKLTGTRMGQRLPPYRYVVVGSDVGRPKEACLYTAFGLQVIDPRQPDVESVLGELRKETGADAVLRIRLRVGVHNGRATIERGSVVDVTTAAGFGDVESIASLVSEELVVDGASDKIANDVAYHVNAAKFREAVTRLAIPYLKMSAMVTR